MVTFQENYQVIYGADHLKACRFWSNLIYGSGYFQMRIKLPGNKYTHGVFPTFYPSPWMLSLVYGPPYQENKREFWEDFRKHLDSFAGPWIGIGDFNCIVTGDEKQGGRPFQATSSTGLGYIIDLLGLVDLGFSGNKHTWTNKRIGAANIRERLDRAISNIDWRLLFPKASVLHLPAVSSDHNPLLLNTSREQYRKPKLFKFEEMWIRDPSCSSVVKMAWQEPHFGSPMFILKCKIQSTRKALRRWNRNTFGHVQSQINQLSEDLNSLQQAAPTIGNLALASTIEEKLQELLQREELLWRQKSRNTWLTCTDLNTKFYHLSTVIQRKQNAIEFLKLPNNSWSSDIPTIAASFIAHFSNLFSTTQPTYQNDFHSLFPSTIPHNEALSLCTIPDDLEIQRAVFAIGALRSPGPDGLPAIFYHKFWKVIGGDTISAVRSFFGGKYLLKSHNHSHIALIPKGDRTATVHNYRPISLCNVFYKIISKILASRLKPLLSNLISPFQSAFVSNKNISENTVIAHEVMHFLNHHRGKDHFVAIKIDMEKAFDRLEWPILLETMKNLGFHDTWIHWISQCISTVSYSVVINGKLYGFLKPSCGIRQGDPLSPFLFLLATEALSRLLSKEEASGNIHGIKIGRGCPAFTHLLFADDLFLFAKATDQNLQSFFDILHKYQSWSGQKAFAKPKISFIKVLVLGSEVVAPSIFGKTLGFPTHHLSLPFSPLPLQLLQLIPNGSMSCSSQVLESGTSPSFIASFTPPQSIKSLPSFPIIIHIWTHLCGPLRGMEFSLHPLPTFLIRYIVFLPPFFPLRSGNTFGG
ncbi:hypothetical protein CRG98_033240 [Punica granatum]|uniref:Reverse transcriptase domain-containing protein n=1 Tax=Punica granatum TaxID=22663 RepID=A0A2I0IQS5_PUNGR|nr:hypothetical protein CRG98_033240 [Punica granatum]